MKRTIHTNSISKQRKENNNAMKKDSQRIRFMKLLNTFGMRIVPIGYSTKMHPVIKPINHAGNRR